jgi:hypothetical protein
MVALSMSGATASSVVETTDYSALYTTGGAEGEYLLSTPFATSNLDGFRYLDTSNTLHTPSGTEVHDLRSGDRYPGASRRTFYPGSSLGEFGDTDTIYSASDYRSGQPTSLIFVALTSILAVVCGNESIYYLDDDEHLYRIDDPLGAATSTLIGDIGSSTYPRVDRQTRTVMGVASEAGVVTDDGTTTTRIGGPSVAGLLSNSATDGCFAAFEVMVRA